MPRYGKTYQQAQQEIFQTLREHGWTVKPDLKVPHATSPDGELRLWFKAQAVHATEGNYHNFGNARNFGFGGGGRDIREMSGEEFLETVERIRKI